MKRILQRKFMLVFWLAMVVNSFSMIATTMVCPLKTKNDVNIGEVTINITETNSGGKPFFTTTYDIKWQRGFTISSVTDPNSTSIAYSISVSSVDENYYYAQSIVRRGYLGIEGDYVTNASINSTVTSPIELKNIFNYYTPNSTQISGDEIVISSDVSGPYYGNAMKLDFQNTDPIKISIQESKRISKFEFEINSGNLNFVVNGTGDYSNYLPDITLNSGNLTLQGEVAGVQNLAMTGGTFTLDGKDGKAAKIDHLEASGGTILVKNNKTRDFFTDLTINGDVSIKGENIYDSQNICEGSDGYIGNTVIKSGTASIEKVSLGTWNLIEIEDGDVTLTDVIFNDDFSSTPPSSQTTSSNILLKSGKLQLDNCHLAITQNYFGDYVVEAEGGELNINGGIYSGGKKAILGITGANATVTINNGIFQICYLSGQGDIAYLQDGKLNIVDGLFQDAPIVAEKGSLSIKGGTFSNESFIQAEDEKDFNLYVKGDNANVILSGGNYSEASVYIDPSVNKQPKDLLESNYEYYTEYNGYYQEEVTQFVQNEQIGGLSGKYLSFDEVRDNKIPDNPCLAVALKADVGPNGKDVKTIETKKDSYNESWSYGVYEILTPVGLLWYAASVTVPEVVRNDFYLDKDLLKEGKAAMKIMADLDMSGYDWVPFQLENDILLDGQGHVISNLSVNQPGNMAFISSNSGMLANLVIKNGTFILKHKHPDQSGNTVTAYAASLVGNNYGTIVNYGVQQCSIEVEVFDASTYVGGLVGENSGGIYNSYVTGDVKCTIKNAIDSTYSCSNLYTGIFDIGGLAGSSGGIISNCYHVGNLECVKPELYNKYMEVNIGDIVGKDYQSSVNEHCYTNPELQTLNSNVISHSHSIGEMIWSKWITKADVNKGYPIHGYNNESIYMGASVIESEFTLLKEGNGEFKATYTYLEDETDPESIKTGTIYADTTYTIINQEQFKITATPAEGSELVKVVHIQNGKETEISGIQPGAEFDYNIVVADTLKAYFKEKGIPSSSCELSGDQDYTLTYTQDAGWSYTTPGNETPVYFTDTICGSTTGSVTVIIPESEYTLVFQNCSVDSLNVKSNAGALWVDGNVVANVATGNIHMKSGSLIQAPEGKGVVTLTKPTKGGSYTAFAFAQTFETGRRLPVGTNVSFTITPEEGYELESALFGKVSMMDTFAENKVNHTITDDDTDLTVTITFKKVKVVSTPLDLTQVTDTVTVSYENNNWYYQETGKEKVVFTGEVTGGNDTVVLLAEDIPTDAPALQFAGNSEVSSLVVSEGSALQVVGSVTVRSVSGNIETGEGTNIKSSVEVPLVEISTTPQLGGSYEVIAFGQPVTDQMKLPVGTPLTFEIEIEEGYELASATIGGRQLVESLSLLRTRAVSTTINRYYKITGDESDLKVEITFRKTNTDEPEDPDTPPVDPVKYYNIYEESICDGVSLSFSKNPVKEGGSISIKVEKDEENYTFENFKVWYKESYYGNWKELKESTQPGEYKIQNIWTHIYVKAEGSEKKNPTGMEEVKDVKVYTKDGSLFVQTPQREQVIVISMTGAVVKNEEQIGLKQYHGLNPGIYIVRIGEQVFKIRI